MCVYYICVYYICTHIHTHTQICGNAALRLLHAARQVNIITKITVHYRCLRRERKWGWMRVLVCERKGQKLSSILRIKLVFTRLNFNLRLNSSPQFKRTMVKRVRKIAEWKSGKEKKGSNGWTNGRKGANEWKEKKTMCDRDSQPVRKTLKQKRALLIERPVIRHSFFSIYIFSWNL